MDSQVEKTLRSQCTNLIHLQNRETKPNGKAIQLREASKQTHLREWLEDLIIDSIWSTFDAAVRQLTQGLGFLARDGSGYRQGT